MTRTAVRVPNSAAREPGALTIVPVQSPWGHRLMFVWLTLLAFLLYAPAVLLPLLREHSAVLREERRLAREVLAMEDQLHRDGLMIAAFESDPIVNERLAQLDLHYERPGEEIMAVSPELLSPEPSPALNAAASEDDDALVPPHWPAWAHETERQARQWGVLRLYLDPSIRVVLMLMAGGLVIAAFVLYPPQSSPPTDRPSAREAA